MDLAASTPQRPEESQLAGRLPPRRILVVIDPTVHEQPALDKAARIAAPCGSRLELYICDVEQQPVDSWAGGPWLGQYRELRRQRLLEDLEGMARPLRERGLQVDVACEWHAPLEWGIAEHTIRSQPDLVVKQAHRHSQLPRSSLSRTDWNLARLVPVPLLLVHARPWPAVVQFAAAVDPCHPADRPVALDEAIVRGSGSLVGMLGGVLDIYHVLQTPPHLPGDPVSPEQKAAAHAEARTAVQRLTRGVQASPRFIEDGIPDGLVRLADQHRPDVLVMGAVARPRSAHAAPGGTAAGVLERVDCDLLVIKPPGYVSPLLVTAE